MLGCIAAIGVGLLLIGCSKPDKPKPVKYNLYVPATHLAAGQGDSSFNRIYIYDADSLTLHDSIWQAHFTESLDVSPDGEWLYVAGFISYQARRVIQKIDIRTKHTVWTRSDLWGVRCIANGTLLLAGRDVLSSDDASLLRHLSDTLKPLFGPVSGTKIAATAGDTVVTVVDVANGVDTGQFVPRDTSGIALSHIYTARLHPDGKRILAVGVYGSDSNTWFVIGDIETGQTLFRYHIYRPQGEIAISSDGNLAAVTSQGSPARGERGAVHVIDLRTLSFIGPTPPFPAGAQVKFLPGDRRIVTAPSADPSFFDAGPLLVTNMTSMALERVIWPMPTDPPRREDIGSLGIGPRP